MIVASKGYQLNFYDEKTNLIIIANNVEEAVEKIKKYKYGINNILFNKNKKDFEISLKLKHLWFEEIEII